jgi:hypothetical protein
VYRVEHRELTEQRTHGAVIPNVFHRNSPLVISALRIACLASFDQRHGGADEIQIRTSKKFKLAIAPFGPIALGRSG